jgi:hypothetical protein
VSTSVLDAYDIVIGGAASIFSCFIITIIVVIL